MMIQTIKKKGSQKQLVKKQQREQQLKFDRDKQARRNKKKKGQERVIKYESSSSNDDEDEESEEEEEEEKDQEDEEQTKHKTDENNNDNDDDEDEDEDQSKKTKRSKKPKKTSHEEKHHEKNAQSSEDEVFAGLGPASGGIGNKIIEIDVERRKGDKIVTIIRGLMDLGMKPKTAQSEFRKKFASGVGQQKNEIGHVEFTIQGDVRYDLVNFLREKWDTPQKLIFYKTKNGTQSAFASDGVVLSPP